MNDRITLRRAVSPRDIARFWDEMDAMLLRTLSRTAIWTNL